MRVSKDDVICGLPAKEARQSRPLDLGIGGELRQRIVRHFRAVSGLERDIPERRICGRSPIAGDDGNHLPARL